MNIKNTRPNNPSDLELLGGDTGWLSQSHVSVMVKIMQKETQLGTECLQRINKLFSQAKFLYLNQI